MSNNKIYEFSLNLAKIPNFDIHSNIETINISKEYLDNYARYLKKIISDLDKNSITSLTVFGGEPFLHFNKIKSFIESLIDDIDFFTIITYGNNILENWNDILNLWHKLSNRFTIKFEWNENHSDSFWYCFNKVMRRKLTTGINARISGNNVTYLPELITNFSKNNSQYINFGTLYLTTLPNKNEYSNYDKEIAKNAIEDSINKASNNNVKVVYNNINNFNKIFLDCMIGDGTIYFNCSVPSINDSELNYYKLGHISDNFNVLLETRLAIRNNDVNNIQFNEAYELHELLQEFNT